VTALAERTNWHGLSLSFVRQVTNQPARFWCCKDAIDNTEVIVTDRENPPIGAYVWFDNDPYGDVGLSLGDGRMLAVSTYGHPVIAKVTSWHHEPYGWSRTIGD
jgi:hypothetical protein